MKYTVTADQDGGVICRAAALAYLDSDALEVIPDETQPTLTLHVMQQVEEFAYHNLNAWIAWTSHDGGVMHAEFTPNYDHERSS